MDLFMEQLVQLFWITQVFCGGSYPYTNESFSYFGNSDHWKEYPALPEKRSLAANHELYDGNWWVGGGEEFQRHTFISS